MKWIKLFGLGTALMFISIVIAYTPPSHDNVVLVLNGSYTPPDHDNVILVLEAGAPAPPVDSCSCPSPAAEWHIDISDNCNITTDCDDNGFDVYFENGTAGDMVNVSAMIIADHFYLQDAGAGTIIHTDPDCYLNTS